MNAVLRVWWIFFTGFPLQRWLGSAGLVFGAGGILAAWLTAEPFWYFLAAIAFTTLAVFPAIFAGGALLRALSAPRNHQLFPHFRTRMLLAVALLVLALVGCFVAFLGVPPLVMGREMPIGLLGYPLGFVTALVLWTFLFCGDSRWGFSWLLLPFAIVAFVESAAGHVADIKSTLVPWVAAASLAAWLVFAAWYLRVRRIPPLLLAPRPWHFASHETLAPATRAAGLRALLAGYVERPVVQRVALPIGSGAGLSLLLAGFTLLPAPADRPPLFTSFIWPFMAMAIAGMATTVMVRRSRALWLHVAGRDGVRCEIERFAWARWRDALLMMLTVAAAASALFPVSPSELFLGLALAGSAVLYGGYVSVAAVPSLFTYFAGFGLMTALQIALLARAAPPATSVVLVIAVQLSGALLLRALAVRRWRRIDWLDFKPLAVLGREPR